MISAGLRNKSKEVEQIAEISCGIITRKTFLEITMSRVAFFYSWFGVSQGHSTLIRQMVI
jgi:hypothetical protein